MIKLLSFTSEDVVDVPAVDFGIKDERGRSLGYSASITRRVYHHAGSLSGRIPRGIVQDGAVTFAGHTSTTRDGKPFGPTTQEIERSTLEEVRREIAKRCENARARYAKKTESST
jgi:hypothetical protein